MSNLPQEGIFGAHGHMPAATQWAIRANDPVAGLFRLDTALGKDCNSFANSLTMKFLPLHILSLEILNTSHEHE